MATTAFIDSTLPPGRSPRLPWLTVIALAAIACSRSHPGAAPGAPGAAAGPGSHVSGTPHSDQVIETLTDSGLHADGFAPLAPVPFGAGYCEQGRIEGIDTLVCEFTDDTALDQGKRLMQDQWEREGVQTGVATATKHTLLGIADRGHHDPNGKTINRILTALKKI